MWKLSKSRRKIHFIGCCCEEFFIRRAYGLKIFLQINGNWIRNTKNLIYFSLAMPMHTCMSERVYRCRQCMCHFCDFSGEIPYRCYWQQFNRYFKYSGTCASRHLHCHRHKPFQFCGGIKWVNA